MTVRRCPTCKTAHQGDGRPGCACTAKEQATAPDFSPLLIRPHIKVKEFADPQGPDAGPTAPEERPPAPDDRATSSVPAVPAAAPAGQRPDGPPAPADRAGTESAVAVGRPRTAGPPDRAAADDAHRRRRVGTVAGVSVAVLAVSAALGGTWLVAENSFSSDGPTRHAAAPTLVMPTGDGAHPSVFPSPTGPATYGTPSPSGPGGSTASGHPTATSSHGASADGSAHPTSSASSGGSGPSKDDAPPVLEMGSTGPEVVDLQRRLKQVGGLYDDDADGVYDEGVRDAVATFQQWRSIQGDPSGVYGSHTREELERETGGPS